MRFDGEHPGMYGAFKQGDSKPDIDAIKLRRSQAMHRYMDPDFNTAMFVVENDVPALLEYIEELEKK